jgi:hypothetical protein
MYLSGKYEGCKKTRKRDKEILFKVSAYRLNIRSLWLCVARLMDDYKLCLPMYIDFSTNVEYQLRHNQV